MDQSTVARSGPIRYATAERFRRPELVDPHDAGRPRDAICPQPPSRLDPVMGPPRDEHPQDEDCLHLAVASPAFDDRARPVVVWLHGGGFSSGAGLLDWYDGGKLAAEGDVVVVGVNYRLGVLGYLRLPGISDGNLGLFDQLEALRWVRANIARFGGDPDDVTVCGQSAGALSALQLLAMPQGQGLLHRAVLQSAPLLSLRKTPEAAVALGQRFADALDDDPRTAEPAAILAAQQAVGSAHAEQHGGLDLPFTPVSDVDITEEPDTSFRENVRGLDVLYGWNLDDMSAFPDHGPDHAAVTESLYGAPLRRFAEHLVETGARVHSYRLDWRPQGSPFGATHCVELPLLFGTRDAWKDAPMLGNTPWSEVEEFGAALRRAWYTFARTGTPDTADAQPWPVSWSVSDR